MVAAQHASLIAHELADTQLKLPQSNRESSDSALERAVEAAAIVTGILDFAGRQLGTLDRWGYSSCIAAYSSSDAHTVNVDACSIDELQ